MTLTLDKIAKPLLVCGVQRSGASLVADLFSHHGWWSGECRSPNRHRPYPNHENVHINAIMNKMYPNVVKTFDFALPTDTDDFRMDVLKCVANSDYTENQNWLIKFDPRWYAIFKQAFPDSSWVCVRRDPLSCYHSCVDGDYFAAGVIDPHAMFVSLHCQNDILDYIKENYAGTDIFTKELIEGHYTPLTKVLRALKVDIDKKNIQKIIDKDLWVH